MIRRGWAISRETWYRHWREIAATAGAVAVLAALAALAESRNRADALGSFGGLVIVLAFAGWFHTATLAETRADRRWGLPAHWLARPITSAELVAWLMLQSAIGTAALWSVFVSLFVWPTGDDIPWDWLPGLIAAALWYQTVCSLAPGPVGGKIVAAWAGVIALLLAREWVVEIIGIIADDWNLVLRKQFVHVRPVVRVLVTGLSVPVAYGLAVLAVARDRQGADALRGFRERIRGLRWGDWPTRFHSPWQALLWSECRRQRWAVGPMAAAQFAAVVMFQWNGLFGPPDLLFPACGFLTGVVAFLAGLAVGRPSGEYRATLPFDDATLARAGLWASVRAPFVATAGVALALAFAWHAGATFVVPDWWFWPGAFGVPVAVWLTADAFLITWSQFVAGLVTGMTGRRWVVIGTVMAYLAVVNIWNWAAGEIARGGDRETALAWVAAAGWAVLAAKFVAAEAVNRVSRKRHRELPIDAAIGLVFWASAVVLLSVPISPIGGPDNWSILQSVAVVLTVPMVRPAAATLATAYGRRGSFVTSPLMNTADAEFTPFRRPTPPV